MSDCGSWQMPTPLTVGCGDLLNRYRIGAGECIAAEIDGSSAGINDHDSCAILKPSRQLQQHTDRVASRRIALINWSANPLSMQ